jgi:SAM (Sterile alpha motif) domain-containing protein
MDVGNWLRSLGFEEFEATFRNNKIDSAVLPKLTAEDLKELGITALGDRRKLLDAIAALRNDANPKLPEVSASNLSHIATVSAAAAPEAGAERRYLTVMFCDLVGSTGIAAKLDAEEWRDLVGAYVDAASAAVTEMGGHVAKKLGDGLLALFGYPVAQENDAERAARAALAIQRPRFESSEYEFNSENDARRQKLVVRSFETVGAKRFGEGRTPSRGARQQDRFLSTRRLCGTCRL